MINKIIAICAISVLFTGCASVPMASKTDSDAAMSFAVPKKNKAGLYVFRDSIIAPALKKDLWVDGECLGESATNVFFFKEIEGDKEHTISTESQFSPNTIKLTTQSGVNYYVRQYITMGVFIGGANLQVVDASQGQAAIKSLKMAQSGNCSQ